MKIYTSKLCTYAHYVNGECIYVGVGDWRRAYDLKMRRDLWKKATSKNHFKFRVKIIKWFNFRDDAISLEIKMIKKLKPKANQMHNGYRHSKEVMQRIREAVTGQKRSLEVCEKISKAKIGSAPWNKGIPCRLSTRRKISEANKGPNYKLRGRPLSEETKRKLSLAMQGRVSPMKGKRHSAASNEKNRIAHLFPKGNSK